MVNVLPIAFSDTTGVSEMILSSLEFGGSGHTVTSQPQSDRGGFEQAVISYKMSDFVRDFDCALPTHIKIDVDGTETDILRHANQVLASPRLRSVIVEINDGQEEILGMFEKHGLQLKSKHKQNHIFERV